jgi:hypothetical protein
VIGVGLVEGQLAHQSATSYMNWKKLDFEIHRSIKTKIKYLKDNRPAWTWSLALRRRSFVYKTDINGEDHCLCSRFGYTHRWITLAYFVVSRWWRRSCRRGRFVTLVAIRTVATRGVGLRLMVQIFVTV